MLGSGKVPNYVLFGALCWQEAQHCLSQSVAQQQQRCCFSCSSLQLFTESSQKRHAASPTCCSWPYLVLFFGSKDPRQVCRSSPEPVWLQHTGMMESKKLRGPLHTGHYIRFLWSECGWILDLIFLHSVLTCISGVHIQISFIQSRSFLLMPHPPLLLLPLLPPSSCVQVSSFSTSSLTYLRVGTCRTWWRWFPDAVRSSRL